MTRSKKIGFAWAASLALALGVIALPVERAAPEEEPTSPSVSAPGPSAPGRARVTDAPSREVPGEAAAEPGVTPDREGWRLRKERAEQTLREYRAATRYPPESRPAVEHPDQMEFPAPERRLPMDGDADHEGALSVVLHQDRVFLSGEESVTLTVRCEDRRGTPQRCQVPPASASELPREGRAPLSPVAVPFGELGGTHTARFAPGQSGFLTTSGTIRVALTVNAGEVRKHAFFDLLYTGLPPATFTGRVRDSVESGSLQLEVGLQVKKPGRYVITGRVDDAGGKPLAWVQFNEELPAGAQQARLTVFGRLILDQQPVFPLRLRDLEGFLLLEQGDPDRELLPSLPGTVHQTRVHPVTAFSGEEWSSEQRARYLEELQRDVDRADEALSAAGGG